MMDVYHEQAALHLHFMSKAPPPWQQEKGGVIVQNSQIANHHAKNISSEIMLEEEKNAKSRDLFCKSICVSGPATTVVLLLGLYGHHKQVSGKVGSRGDTPFCYSEVQRGGYHKIPIAEIATNSLEARKHKKKVVAL